MRKYELEKRVPGVGDIAKTLSKFDQLLTGKFLEDFSLLWEEDGEKQFIKWKNQDYQEEVLEKPKDTPVVTEESNNENKNEFLNEADTAQYIQMSKSFLRKARCEGQIGKRTPGPPYYKIGRAVRYSIEDLDQWLKEHRIIK